jgi:hypothetical protein
MRLHGPWLVLVGVLMLSGCATQTTSASGAGATATRETLTESIRSKLVGTWEYEYNGVKVEVVYTPTTVALAGVPPTPYTLEGNEITVDIVGPKTSVIEFKGNDVMVQTNKTDGQRYVFKRKRQS